MSENQKTLNRREFLTYAGAALGAAAGGASAVVLDYALQKNSEVNEVVSSQTEETSETLNTTKAAVAAFLAAAGMGLGGIAGNEVGRRFDERESKAE